MAKLLGKKEINISDRTKGIGYIIFAALGFAFMTFFVRLSGELPTLQKAFFRNLVAVGVSAFILARTEEKFYIKRESWGDILLRCVFGTSGVVANFYAIDRLDIADANMLNKLSPFFAILMSIPILKEVPKRRDIIFTMIAFLGAVLIIRPGDSIYSIPALIGLYGGFGAGMAYVFVRRLGKKGERTPVIVFCFSVFSCLAIFPFMMLNYQPMNLEQVLCLIMAGVSATVGQFGITNAYKYAPAKEISVFDYTQVVFAAIIGMLFFAELPELLSIVGYIIIIGVAVLRWRMNLKETE